MSKSKRQRHETVLPAILIVIEVLALMEMGSVLLPVTGNPVVLLLAGLVAVGAALAVSRAERPAEPERRSDQIDSRACSWDVMTDGSLTRDPHDRRLGDLGRPEWSYDNVWPHGRRGRTAGGSVRDPSLGRHPGRHPGRHSATRGDMRGLRSSLFQHRPMPVTPGIVRVRRSARLAHPRQRRMPRRVTVVASQSGSIRASHSRRSDPSSIERTRDVASIWRRSCRGGRSSSTDPTPLNAAFHPGRYDRP